jgi:hypothetical protein
VSDSQAAGTGTNDAGEPQKTADGQTPEAKGNDASANGASVDDKSGTATKAGDKPADGEVAYEFKTPEGVTLDTESVTEFTAIAKELKLPAEAAQKVVDLAIKREAARTEAWHKQVESWSADVNKDPELSKPEVQADARKAVETFGSPELKTLLNSTGMGNHPELVRLMAKIGKAISEDKVLGKSEGGNKPARDAASILYGNPKT